MFVNDYNFLIVMGIKNYFTGIFPVVARLMGVIAKYNHEGSGDSCNMMSKFWWKEWYYGLIIKLFTNFPLIQSEYSEVTGT
ncbi:MAG: hypothetical protein K0R28_7061 [Paenibacillus sp.]|jgi:hypothetical protein|nr:hypothetical protein [Paenibacillus sp.]